MALSTFNPPVAPSPGTTGKTELKLLEAEFGDGYTGSAPDGINFRRRVVTLAWDALTESQKNAIDNFFYNQGGYKPFYYKPPGFAAAIKWTCKEFDWKKDAGIYRYNATLRQSFDPAV